MKTLLRRLLIYLLILFILPTLVPGFHISGGVMTFIIAALIFTLLMLVIKPILSIVTFPINLLTLGMFSLVTNAVILYLFTVLVTSVSLMPFIYPSFQILGVGTPAISFNVFFAYIFTSFVIGIIDGLCKWLAK